MPARTFRSLSIARRLAAILSMVIPNTSAAGQGPSTRSVSMQELTVPDARLPAGCALAPADSQRLEGKVVRSGLWTGLPITANPWTGTDAPIIARIRERLEPSARAPDGPPPSRGELSRFRLRWAEGVEEGYAAVYTQSAPESPPVLVYGLRFAGARQLNDHLNAAHPVDNTRMTRIVVGSLVAVVHGDGGECSEAVGAYLRSLAR